MSHGPGKKDLNPEDQAAWDALARTVAPLKRKGKKHDETVAPPEPVGGPLITAAPPTPKAPRTRTLETLVVGAIHTMDKRTAQRLKRGALSVDGHLDLHGHTREAAHRALRRFLQHHTAMGSNTVMVVTGKGLRGGPESGVLKREVPRWLNQPDLRPLVVAATPARPRDGGEGALYIKLKRQRQEP